MTACVLMLACLLDAVLGDPRWLPHPVRLMGRAIAWYDRTIRLVARSSAGERVAGIALAGGLPVATFSAAWIAIELTGSLHEMARKGLEVLLAFTTLAARDLADHAERVRRALEAGSLEQAREAVARIVGRDTAHLSETEIVRATVETISENTCDGVMAPLLYLALGGAPLALAYKAINTLDSMVGSRERKYLHLGWASARIDDGVNWIPARVSAALLVLAVGVLSRSTLRARQAWRILLRDGRQHPSPNSGWPESAMAGGLQVQLGGVNFYHGVRDRRPTLGDPIRPLQPIRIREALVVMWIAYLLATVSIVGLLSL